MLIKDIKKENRPIEKLISKGPETLSNEELLAIIINTGTKNKSALDISYDILNSVENLSDILNMQVSELIKFDGIKNIKAARIEASFELTRRLLYNEKEKTQIITHSDAVKLIYPKLAHLKNEQLLVFFLDNKCNLIKSKTYQGINNTVSLPINDIIKESILIGARGILLAHNHPTGDPNPSTADLECTIDFEQRANVFELILFDHIIIGDNKYFSYNENQIFEFDDLCYTN